MAQLIVDGKTLEFDLGKLLNVEVIAIEKVTGLSFKDLGERVAAVDFAAITALVWVLRKRDEPQLRYDDVVFPIDSLSFVDGEAVDPKGETSEPSPLSDTSPLSPTSSGSAPGTSSG